MSSQSNNKATETINTIKIIEDDELSGKEIRDTFYHCRDFEINNLWQRSIFLFGFMLACFTGYGTILIALLSTGEERINYPYLANLVECIIALIGIVFSVIWIIMGKGSKLWYEIYERAIGDIENKNNNTDGCNSNRKYVIIPTSYIMGNYCNKYKDFVDNSIWSTKAGQYSPSKLNIFIGQVLFVVWLIIFLSHFGILIYNFVYPDPLTKQTSFIYENRDWIYMCIAAISAYLIMVVFIIFSNQIKSTST